MPQVNAGSIVRTDFSVEEKRAIHRFVSERLAEIKSTIEFGPISISINGKTVVMYNYEDSLDVVAAANLD